MTTYEQFMTTMQAVNKYVEQQEQEAIMQLVEFYLEDEQQK